jgi:hypothetical protein
MKQKRSLLLAMVIIAVMVGISGCETEDPGPLQYQEKEFSHENFDRLEMGSGFHIDVEESAYFRINVSGDSRNLNDLDVYKKGSTLVIEFDENANRRHDTYIKISMPTLKGINFSGGSISYVEGFESDGGLDFVLSGGSVCTLEAGYRALAINLSGASKLRLNGLGDEINGTISGASKLEAFDYPVASGDLDVSGASHVDVTVSHTLTVGASGASFVYYRGNPALDASVSGGSVVERD